MTTEPRPVPLVRERLEIDKRTVETGRVRVSTRVVETRQAVDLSRERDVVDIETVTIGRVVEAALPPRQEGDVTIVPVYEERLVTTRQLVLKEELHLRRRRIQEPAEPQVYTLRHDEVSIERLPSGDADEEAGDPAAPRAEVERGLQPP